MRRACWLILVLLAIALPAAAVTRYADHNVSTCGTYNPATRSCSGGSAQAYNTIVECLNATFAGDTCMIRGNGEFYSGVDYSIETDQGETIHSGSSWSNFVSVRGYQSERPMVRKIEITGSVHFVKFENLEIDGGSSEGDILYVGSGAGDTWWSNVLVHHASNCPSCSGGVQWPPSGSGGNIIEYSAIYDNALGTAPGDGHKHGLYTGAHNSIIRYNHIYHNSAYGIHNYVGDPPNTSDNVQIYGNRIHDNGVDGGSVAGILCGNTVNCRIWNNLIYNEPNNGIEFSSAGCSGNYALNNTIYNIVGAGIENNCSGSPNWLVNNAIVNAGAALTNYQTPANPNTTNYTGSNPGFTNPGAGDFTLSAGSPLINAGTNLASFFSDDFGGTSRPQGGVWDIGAYEYGGVVTSLAVTLNAAPTSRTVGQNTAASWTVTAGTGGPLDYVALFPVGSPNSAKINFDGAGVTGWQYTGGASSGSFLVVVPNLLPGLSGTYEFRYCTNDTQNCIATSPTVTVTGPIIVAPNSVLSHAGQTVTTSPAGCDSQETSGEDGRCLNVLDNNPATFWTTTWTTGPPPQPHQIIINLGGSYAVSGWVYLPRQDGCSNGSIINWSLYVSTDGTTYGAALTTGTFAATAVEKVVLAGSTQVGNFIKIVSTSAIGPGDCAWLGTDVSGPWTAAAEIYALIDTSAVGYVMTQRRWIWQAANGAAIAGCIENAPCPLPAGVIRQLRVKLTATSADPPSLSVQLQCRTAAGAYTTPPTSCAASDVCMSTDAGFTNGQPTNRALTLDQATFVPGAYVMGTATAQTINLSLASETEYVWMLATKAGLATGTAGDCKVVFSDLSPLQAYTTPPGLPLWSVINATLRLNATTRQGVSIR